MPTNAASNATAGRMRSASAASALSASGIWDAGGIGCWGSSNQLCRINCAATWSRTARPSRPGSRPPPPGPIAPLRVVQRSSTSTTGRPKRPSSCRAKRCARCVMSCASRRHAIGGPTTSVPGCHSATSAAIAAKRSSLRSSSNRGQRVRRCASAYFPSRRQCAACRNRTRALSRRGKWRPRVTRARRPRTAA